MGGSRAGKGPPHLNPAGPPAPPQPCPQSPPQAWCPVPTARGGAPKSTPPARVRLPHNRSLDTQLHLGVDARGSGGPRPSASSQLASSSRWPHPESELPSQAPHPPFSPQTHSLNFQPGPKAKAHCFWGCARPTAPFIRSRQDWRLPQPLPSGWPVCQARPPEQPRGGEPPGRTLWGTAWILRATFAKVRSLEQTGRGSSLEWGSWLQR